MTRWIDLHIHSYFSDGLASPEEILSIARKKNLAAISICDHDNCGGFEDIQQYLRSGDPGIISGVELSAGTGGEDIHILGYMFDPDLPVIKDALDKFRNDRNLRGEQMVLKLRKMGIDIPIELVYELAGLSAIGRPNVADAMIRVGAIKRFEEAFEKYIGLEGPAYVPKENLTPKDAIELIHNAKGLAFMAHPGVANAMRHVEEFIDYGLDGLEVYHPYHTQRVRNIAEELADKNGLLKSGGSDFHGRERHPENIGSQQVPYDLLEKMKKRLNK